MTNSRLRRLIIAASLVLLISGEQAEAQDAATVGGLLLLEGKIKNDLQDLIGQMGGEAQAVMSAAANAMDTAAAQLRELVNGDLGRQIAALTGSARDLATQIDNTVKTVDQLLKIRMQCGFEGADRLVYGIRTLGAQLQAAIPFIKAAQPFLASFTFSGHVPGVVPREFGRVTVQGAQLWRNNIEPRVDLVNAQHSATVATVKAERGNGSDSLSFFTDARTMLPHAGECLDIRITPRHKEGVIFTTVVDDSPLYLPICIPRAIATSYAVSVTQQDACPHSSEATELPLVIVHCLNSSCEDAAHPCGIAPVLWDLPPGCVVDGYRDERGSLTREATHVVVNWATIGNQVKASPEGTLGKADCADLVVGKKLNHPAEWQRLLAPRIKCASTTWRSVQTVSKPQAVSTDTLPICVRTQSSCATRKRAFSVAVQTKVNGVAQPNFTLPTLTLDQVDQGTFHQASYRGMTVAGSVNSAAGNDQGETCLNISVQSCGY